VKINNGAVVKRLHYLMDFLNFDIPNTVENKLINNYSDSYSLLDNTLSDKGKYRSKWKLRINVNEDDLLEEEY
ncbi:MAG: transcriptional regulator, partial [Thermoplasmata archaeon]